MATDDVKQKKGDASDKRVLILDDDDSIRDMLRFTVAAEGFMVRTVRDGRDIQDVVDKFPPDLVITDIMMPGGGGYELIRTLQGVESTRHIPVLVMTGAKLDTSTKGMMRQEPNVKGLVDKPINMKSFIQMIHDILNTKSRDEVLADHRQKDISDFNIHDKFQL